MRMRSDGYYMQYYIPTLPLRGSLSWVASGIPGSRFFQARAVRRTRQYGP